MSTKWIIIADGAKARIYAYDQKHQKLTHLEGADFQHVNKPSRELMATKRGRMLDNGTGHRSAMERPTDPHQYEKYLFARELTTYLEEHINAFDTLILIASPKVLGDIRHLWSKELERKITGELNKDLTNIPEPELQEYLYEILKNNE